MFTRDQFLAEIDRETAICKHLHEKMGVAEADRSPGEGVRTNLELLEYLTMCAEVPAQAIIESDWQNVREQIAQRPSVSFEGFPAAMDEQARRVRAMVSKLSEKDLLNREAPLPWGTSVKLGHALASTSLAFLTAYRMQLFLHLKTGGHTELNTRNCWMGSDPA